MLYARQRSWYTCLYVLLFVSAGIVFQAAVVWAQPLPRLKKTARYAPDRLIIKYRAGVGTDRKARVRRRIGAETVRTLKSSGAAVLRLGPGVNVDQVIEQLKSDPDVLYARRDHYLYIHRTLPNDPDFESCWGLENVGQMLGTPDADIDAPEAWDITTGSASVIVGVVDTGVDYMHQDLAANMWTNTAELNGVQGVDDDGNGYVDDIYGISVIDDVASGDPYDDHGHGTHVAGIAGAVGNNSRGVAGVNWTTRIMALKFLDSNGFGLESDAATCIEYAIAHGAEILNNSYGGNDDVPALYDAIAAANAAGVLFCASAGNDTMDNDLLPSYPGSYDLPNILCVTSTGGSDNISYFSNYGATSVDLGAPGEAIWSTWPGNEYQLLDGTSMACPFVAGVAALVKANEPALSMNELHQRVMWTGDPCFDLRTTTVSGLRVNAYNALTGIYAIRIVTPSPLPTAVTGATYATTLAAEGFDPPYTWTWSAPEYVERETANEFKWGSGGAQGWHADEGMWHLDLPFSFPFYGESEDDVYVCSNGYIEFSDTTPIAEWASDTSLLASKRMIAVYWSDLTTDTFSGSLDVYVWQPSAESIAIRWQAEEAEWLLGLPINAQLVLHSDGRIEMNYGPDNLSLVGGLVGISAGNGTDYRLSYEKSSFLELGWAPSSLWLPAGLPPGLNMNAAAGTISGIPSTRGMYDFDVGVEDASGGTDVKQFELKVRGANDPTADFEADPIKGDNPMTVQFTDLSTSTPGIDTWAWNLGDASSSSAQNPSHTYANPGKYTVALTVTDENGSDSHLKIRYVEVLQTGSDVDFEGTPTVGYAPLSVSFTDLTPIIADDILLQTWDFGDGGTSFERHPTHVYETPGTYDVSMEIIDWYGGVGAETKFNYITVLAPSSRKGDFDNDDDVDFWDFMAFIDVYGLTSEDPEWLPDGPTGDFDDDDDVDFWDFMAFIDVYGT